MRRLGAVRRTTRSRLTYALVCLAVACMSGPTSAWQTDDDVVQQARAKLDRILLAAVDRGSDDSARVIVRATEGELDALRRLVEDSGHDVIHEFSSIGALTVKLAVDELLQLAADPAVASVSSDGKLGPDPVHHDALTTAPSGTQAVLITTAPGRVPHVLADLEMHRDQVMTSNHETHRIAANVHAGDVDVLARNPSIVSIEVDSFRRSSR